MIKVKVTNDGIDMKGHAECSVNGQDIVCAAVSALTCNLINSLEQLTATRIKSETGAGFTRIRWDSTDYRGKVLIDSWMLGMTAINQQYNCISFE